MRDFPRQDEADRRAGDAVLAGFRAFLQSHVDPTAIDAERRLPDDVVKELRERGYLRAMLAPDLGGLGLSAANAFRLVETAASWSSAVAFAMSISNGFGAGAYLPVLGEGPLHDLIRQRFGAGAIGAGADAEPTGTANSLRRTTATPTPDGEGYLLNGEKVFIGNAPIAELLDVTATVLVDGEPQTQAFFVETDSPGFEVVARHDYMGLGGAPNGALRLTDVRVPRHHAFAGSNTELRRSRELAEIGFLARTLAIAAPSLATARLCLHWSREFVNRRTVDGRRLGEYEEIQRIVADTLGDVFAIESVARWTLLGGSGADTLPEHAALKNIASLTCWRVVDRTMSLLGGEGFETAVSKARRGADPLPLERFFRDARGLRISGGVDFLLDWFAAQGRLAACYAGGDFGAEPGDEAGLTGRNLEHLRAARAVASQLGETCRALVESHPDRAELFARQHLLITLNRIANELLAISAVLARAAAEPGSELLADVYCAGARERIAALRAELDGAADEPDRAAAGAAWLGAESWSGLLDDVLTATAPVR
jgi:alkylation response protein AidB-like acyl-CoA dehydrogenase